MTNKIRAILRNKDNSQLLKNFFSLAMLKLINAILPFVTLPYLIRVLGIRQYGAIVLALSLIAYFQAITDYGFNLSATRQIAKHRSSNKQLILIYNKIMMTKVYLLLFCLTILIPIIFIVPQFKEDILVYLLMCLMLIGQTLFPEWFFRGVEQMGYISVLNLVVKMSFTIGVFTLIKAPQDYWLYPFLLGVSYIIVAFIAHYIIINKFNLKIIFIKFKRVKSSLKTGFPLFVNQFAPNFYNNTTNFLVGMILGKTFAGYFGATRQVVQILEVFNAVVSGVAFPYLIRHKEKFDIFSKYYIVSIIVLVALVVLIHPYVFMIIGIDYNYDSEVFYILMLGLLSRVVHTVYSTNYLISRGHDYIVMRLTLLTSVIGFLMSSPLIFSFGLLGGATNIFLSQLILGCGGYYFYTQVNKKDKVYLHEKSYQK